MAHRRVHHRSSAPRRPSRCLSPSFRARPLRGVQGRPVPELDRATAANGLPCFTGRYDWRLPTTTQLKSILDMSAAGCGTGGACIASIFGPTAVDVRGAAPRCTGRRPPTRRSWNRAARPSCAAAPSAAPGRLPTSDRGRRFASSVSGLDFTRRSCIQTGRSFESVSLPMASLRWTEESS